MASYKKRFVALLCATSMVVTGLTVTTPSTVEAQCLDGLTDVGREVAAEGCVLIKNDNNVLPLEDGVNISVFGRAQCNYYKSGTGSGGDVKVPYTTGILEGLRKNPKVKVNEELAKVYTEWVKTHPFDNGGGGWAAEPWFQEEMPLDADVAEAAKEKADTAVVLIGRTAGEDKDGANTEGSYQLTAAEKEMLQVVTDTFEKVVVVLNVPAIIDMNWVNEYENIDSVLYAWQGGMSGGDGVADVLTGDVNPSGRLTDTIAVSYDDYPSSKYFGRTDYNFYVEDIYVGYRYFETFAPDKVAYPFGYGLSYTTFETSTYSVTRSGDYIHVFVTVENTGDRAGKETVQVYYGAPQGKLGNPSKELAAFAKTKLLQPGESEDMVLSFRIDDMASYDDGGYTGHDSAYVLEAGDYKVYVGNDVRSSKLEYTYRQEETTVVEQLSEQMAPVKEFERFKPVEDENGNLTVGFEAVPTQTVDVQQKIADNLPQELEVKDEQHYDLIDVYNGEVTTEQFVAQMTNEELSSLVRGEGMEPEGVTPGVAAAFGGVSTMKDGKKVSLTDEYGIPRATAADGPSGIRQTAAATSIPGGASIACTWNTDLIEKLSRKFGEEMLLNNIDTILGPGINLHRNPLNGRNFEYYSEDPLVTGIIAAAVTRGIQSTGATVTLKHFAANNQETNRHVVDSRVSERALREIYLKCFEIAVKEGKARSIMTGYNPVNGSWTGSNYDLTTEILREEWGYDGMVMSDWWAEMNKEIGDGNKTTNGIQYLASMVKAQNDIYMVTPDASVDYATNWSNVQLPLDMAEGLETGYITRAELQRSAVNLCNYLLKSQSFATLNNLEFAPYYVTGEDWFKVEKSQFGTPELSGLTVGGRKVITFKPDVREYKVYYGARTVSGSAIFPEVAAEAAQGSSIRAIEQATEENPVAKIYVTESGEEIIYRVIFTDEEGLPLVFESAVTAELNDIKVDGETIEGFDPAVYDYAYPVDTLEEEPDITFMAPGGVDASVSYNADTRLATIKCSTADQVKYYRIQFGISPQSDEFDEDGLKPVWTVENENPDNWKVSDNTLTITTERGSNYQTENDMKNQIVQSAFGDWEAVTKLNLDVIPNTNYQSGGIMVKEDDENYVILRMEYNSWNNPQLSISLGQEVSGSFATLTALSGDDMSKFGNTLYLKLRKIGNTYTAFVSQDGENYTQLSASASADYANPKFGLAAGNGGADAPGVKVSYDYVRFDTEVAAPVVNIGDSTKLKVAEVEPAEISNIMKPETCQDEDGGLNFGNCQKGEYAVYNINVAKTGIYDFTTRIASNETGTAQVKMSILIDGQEATSFITNGTGGWQSWVTSEAKQVKLTEGEHTLKVYFDMAGMNLNWIQMNLKEELKNTELATAIAEAKALDVSTYPAVRQEALSKALEAAEAAVNGAVSQKEIDDALAALNAAVNNLAVETEIAGIIMDTEALFLNPGGKATVKASVSPADATQTLIWSSSNEDIATVDNGVITAKKEGTAVITVSNGGTAKAAVRVVVQSYAPAGDVPMTSIKLSTDAISLKPGTSVSLSATPTPANTTEDIVWSSSDEKIAKVDNGLVTAVKEGTATITASNGKQVKATAVITVKNEKNVAVNKGYIKDVKVTLKKKTLYVGGNKDNTTTVNVALPANAEIESVDYSTSKPKVATVNVAGKITAKAKGKAKIYVTVKLTNGESQNYTLNVTVKKAYIKKVSVPSTIRMNKTKSVTLKAKVYGSSKKITWKIQSGSKYASITRNGKLTVKKKGTVKVVATSGKIKKTFKIRIK